MAAWFGLITHVTTTPNELRTDVAVIGGGVIGLSTAFALAQRGISVVVIEADELATGSSSGNAGHIVPSHVIPFAAPGMVKAGIKDLFNKHGAWGVSASAGPSLIPFMIRFALNCTKRNVDRGVPALSELSALSVSTLSSWSSTGAWANSMRPTGLLQVFRSEASLSSAAHEAEAMAAHGVAVRTLDAAGVCALEPGLASGAVGGVHLVNDGCLDPAQLLRDLAAGIESHGGRVITGARLASSRALSSCTRLTLSTGDTVEAGQVVVAAGVWSGPVMKLLGHKMRVPLMPARGYSCTLRLRDAAAFTHPMILGEAHVAVTPLENRVRLTGRYELAGREREINEKRVSNLVAAAREYLQLPATMHIENKWTGLRPSTPDGIPMIGRVSPTLTLATGHGMLGTSLGPGTGELVARILAGEAHSIPMDALSPLRF